jgi:integrase
MTFELSLSGQDLAIDDKDKEKVLNNLFELRDDVWDTMAAETQKAYKLDFNQYLVFCREHHLPVMASDWQQTKKSCKAYFEHMMESPLAHFSIKRKLAAIRFFIGMCELPDPWKHSKLFTKYVNGKLKSKPAAQRQAKPLMLKDVEALNRELDNGSLLQLRDVTLINVAIDTLFRASNLVAIELDEIDFDKQTIFVPYSKTDQKGEGFYGYISEQTIAKLKEWLARANISEGYVFRSLSPKQTVQNGHIKYQALLSRFKTFGKEGKLSCHSTRVGATLTMMEAEVPLADIIRAGHWKNEAMPIRYGKQFTAAKTGMAKVR